MNHLEQAEKTAKHLNHKDTVSFIRGLKSKRVFKIKSKFPTIEGIKCEIVKSDRCFKFECDGLSSSVSPVVYQPEHYGYGDPFELVNDNERILIQNGIGKISMKLAKRFASEGEFWEVESNFRKTPCCHRAIISLDGFYKPPVEFIQSGSFRIGDSLRVAGFINLTISEYPIGFYDYNIDEKKSIFIDCYAPIKSDLFQKIIESIVYSYALVSGCLIRGEITILQSESASFDLITGYQFARLDDSLHGVAAIDPRMAKEFFKSKTTSYMPSDNFRGMIQKALDDVRFLRAIKIITESFGNPSEIRTATYSVALETLKNIILENNETKINPIKSKADAKKIISDFKSMISPLDDKLFNNKNAILTKLEHLNQVTNSDSFLLSFSLQGITLSHEDEKCIEMRNDFLHGRIPFQNEKAFDEEELNRTVFKFHFLVTALIFKMVSYKGYLINNVKMIDVLRYKKYDSNTPLFREI